MPIKQGSLPWLLRHELRLWWRMLRGKWVLVGTILFCSVLLLLLLGVWLFAVTQLTEARSWVLGDLRSQFLWPAIWIWWGGFLYAFVQALGQSVVVLGDRNDLDLLIASPISSKVIFSSRLLSVAIELFIGFCGFLILPIGLGVLFGLLRLLGVFPALFCLCLMATSLAMLVMLWFVRWLGAKRARLVVQVLATALFALLFLASQLPSLLLDTAQMQAIAQQVAFLFQPGGLLSAESWLWLPARAMFFEPGALVFTGLISLGSVWLTVEVLHQTFIGGTQESLTAKAPRSHRAPRPFNTNLNRVVLLKEWRMIWRNPYIISQVVISIIFFIPLMFLLLRDDATNQFASLGAIATTASPLIGMSLVAGLALICLSGEEAPDLLRSAPVRGPRFRYLKLLAILLPIWSLAVPIAILLMVQGEPWLPMVLVFGAATTYHALLRLWNARPVALANISLQKRQNPSRDVVLGMLEFVSYFGWLGLGHQTGQGHGEAVVGLAIALAGVLAIAYWRSRALGSTLGF